MKVLITGSSGFIGRYTVRMLQEMAGQDVIDYPIIEEIDPQIYFTSTILNKELLREKLINCDYVIHLGAASGSLTFNPIKHACEVNCIGTLNLLDESVQAGVKKIVFATTGSSYAFTPIPHKEDCKLNIPNFYTATKLFNEYSIQLYKELYGLDYVILRYGSVYGPHESKGNLANVISQFVAAMSFDQSPVLFGDGSQTRDFVFAKDVAAANIFAMFRLKNDIFNVGTGVSTSFNEVVELINKFLGKDIKPIYKQFDTKVQTQYVAEQRMDISKITQAGWEWQYSVEDGIKEYAKS